MCVFFPIGGRGGFVNGRPPARTSPTMTRRRVPTESVELVTTINQSVMDSHYIISAAMAGMLRLNHLFFILLRTQAKFSGHSGSRFFCVVQSSPGLTGRAPRGAAFSEIGGRSFD